VRLGGRGFGFGGALLGGGDPFVGLRLDLLTRLLELDLELNLSGLLRIGDGSLGRSFRLGRRDCEVLATISSRSACEFCCSSSKACSARSRAASAPATRDSASVRALRSAAIRSRASAETFRSVSSARSLT